MISFDYDQSAWGAQKVFDDGHLSGAWNPTEDVIHYGGNAVTDAYAGVEREMQVLRIYEQSHLSRGWRAIAYNYAFGNSGATYRLRGENPPGATKGHNSYTRSLLWIGGGTQEPTDAAFASMRRSITNPVFPHSHYRPTACPGDHWRDWITNLENGTEQYGMPYEQFVNFVKSLFLGRPDEFQGDPAFFYLRRAEWVALHGDIDGGIYDQPEHADWPNFWNAFVRVIS